VTTETTGTTETMRKTIVDLVRICIPMLMILTGCPYGYKYDQGWLPTTPVNLEDFNTEWDDYNMDAPVFEKTLPILFSSNRNSKGGNFDIVFKIFEIWFDRNDGNLTVGAYQYELTRELLILQMVPPTINTSYNELGPYLIDYYSLQSSYDWKYEQKYLVLYANDHTGGKGGYDLYWVGVERLIEGNF
jgi:hypothetical protein